MSSGWWQLNRCKHSSPFFRLNFMTNQSLFDYMVLHIELNDSLWAHFIWVVPVQMRCSCTRQFDSQTQFVRNDSKCVNCLFLLVYAFATLKTVHAIKRHSTTHSTGRRPHTRSIACPLHTSVRTKRTHTQQYWLTHLRGHVEQNNNNCANIHILYEVQLPRLNPFIISSVASNSSTPPISQIASQPVCGMMLCI